jgi:hypothetical protein
MAFPGACTNTPVEMQYVLLAFGTVVDQIVGIVAGEFF